MEDFLDQPAAIEVIGAADIYEREKALLSRAKALFPRLPVNDVNVLVIQRIGKEISGSGMDPNDTGRTYDFMEDDFSESLRADRVVVLNLSEKTMGNGIGLGNADIITEKVYRSLDYEATLMNALTSISLRKAFIPVRLPTDRAAIQAGFVTIGPIPPQKVRAIIIKDTAHVSEFWVSQALLPEIHAMENAEILGERQLAFDSKDNIIGFNLDLT